MTKAIVFTLDAIFALLIAASGIALLVYFVYAPQLSFAVQYTSASNLVSNLEATALSSLSQQPLVQSMIRQGSASNQTWDMRLKNEYNNAGNPAGPQSLTLAYTVNAVGLINNGTIVADYGNVYFAAGNEIYAANATTGNILWTSYAPPNGIYYSSAGYQPAVTDQLVYGGMLIYATVANLTALNARNGAVEWSVGLLWPTGVGPVSEPNVNDYPTLLSILNGKLLVGTYGHDVGPFINGHALYAVYPNNGTTIGISGSATSWIGYVANAGGDIVGAQAGQALPKSNPSVSLYTPIYNSTYAAGTIWSVDMAQDPSGISTYGNIIAVGDGTDVYLLSLGGNILTFGTVGGAATGVSIYKGGIVAQSGSSIFDYNQTGNVLWSSYMDPYSYGGTPYNRTPVMSSQDAYALWGISNLTAQNLTTGAVSASVLMPYGQGQNIYLNYLHSQVSSSVYPSSLPNLGSLNPYMALAYGMLFVSEGSHLMAFGSCPANLGDSVLAAAATLYMNGQGSCAQYLLGTLGGNSNYTIIANNRPLMYATLFSNSYLVAPTVQPQWTSCNFTLSAWSYDLGMPGGVRGGVASYFSMVPGNWLDIESDDGNVRFEARSSKGTAQWSENGNFIDNWTFTAITVTQGIPTAYINNNNYPTPVQQNVGCMGLDTGIIGAWDTYFNGNVVNVQLYNSSLTQGQIGILYREGISGQPLSRQHLLQWLPLEGNTNNYAQQYSAAFPVGNVMAVKVSYNSSASLNAYSISAQSAPTAILNYTTGTWKGYSIGAYSWR
jgi:hypothetical protein